MTTIEDYIDYNYGKDSRGDQGHTPGAYPEDEVEKPSRDRTSAREYTIDDEKHLSRHSELSPVSTEEDAEKTQSLPARVRIRTRTRTHDDEKDSSKPHILDANSSPDLSIPSSTPLTTLLDADEALGFLSQHPRALELASAGEAILASPLLKKKLERKIDLTIAPILALVYFLQFLDKTTLQYTAVMGLRDDAKLEGQDYSVVSLVFYLGFLVAEFPTQYLAQKISRIGLYLGVNMVLWGIVLACHAACSSFISLVIVRTLLGVFESCTAPILILIISMWYKKSEQGRRISWFYVCNYLAIIFGGIVSYGVSFTTGSIASWRVFFVVIGLLTVLAGCAVVMWLPDSPVRARRFTEEEKVAVLLRVREDFGGTQNSRIKKSQVFETFKDLRVWLICICTLLSSIPNGGLSNFSSILLTTFGYSPREALILNAPGGAIGLITVLLIGYFSDKWHDRSTIMLLCIMPTILGAGLMIGLDPNGIPKNKAGLLAGGFLSGTFGASFMLLLAWNASNISGHTKKVTTNALTLISFSIGNVLGALSFQDSQAPGYLSGKITIAATLGALCGVVLVLRWYNDRLNRQKQAKLDGMSEEQRERLKEEVGWMDLGDRGNLFFRYTH